MGSLTNEGLTEITQDNFLLTNQAIRLAKYYMACGKDVSLSRLLHDVKNHPEILDQVKDIPDDVEVVEDGSAA